jgi:hypothetical protein
MQTQFFMMEISKFYSVSLFYHIDKDSDLLRIVMCRALRVTYRRVLDWMIGFINTLFTQLGTTGNYITIAILHTLQFTVTDALGFSTLMH